MSHSFTGKGQRKKIIDDHDKIFSEIEISKLLSNNKIFRHKYHFSNISLMFVQFFRSHFSEEIFYDLCLNGSVYKHTYVSNTQKTHQTDQSNQNHNKGKNKKKRKEIFT